MKLDDKILKILERGGSFGEWEIAREIYPWGDDNRSKHGAWIRCIVQALWRLHSAGKVGYFWTSHGIGVSGDRLWCNK